MRLLGLTQERQQVKKKNIKTPGTVCVQAELAGQTLSHVNK